MKERGWIEPIVERVVGQVLDSHAAALRTEIVRRVMEEITAAPSSDEPAPAEPISHHAGSSSRTASGPADLARAVAEIQLGTSQKEILRALLDTSARYATRVALFVVKGSHATGWQARGFANSDAIKDFALDESAPAISHAIGNRVVLSAPVAEMDSRFLQEVGTPANGESRIFPLILKDKVAALIYADSGTGTAGLLEAGALELLVLSTGAWLEINSLRKQAQKEPSASHAESSNAADTSYQSSTQAAPIHQAPAHTPPFNDPFTSHAPAFSSHAKAAAASAGEASVPVASAAVEVPAVDTDEDQTPIYELQSAVVEMDPALAEPLPSSEVQLEAEPQTPPAASLAMSPEDQDVHRKAQRFSRLLVDEIKLYNQAKVAEGRKNNDLYDRLKDAIEKSRATYHKRYGSTVAASANYFQHEIIRSLAEDDVSIMGANFRQ
jgi:hypothetical protein